MAIITGLNADLYYSDNPIIVTFDELYPSTTHIDINIINPLSAATQPLRLYVDDYENMSYDIAPLIKAQFREYEHDTDYFNITPYTILNNWRNVNLIFYVYSEGDIESVSLNKTYVKGGTRFQNSNTNTHINRILSPTIKLPQWGGYPVAYYYFDTNKELKKNIILPEAQKEIRKIKGCNPLYLKFRNSFGGYSYWLFESYEEKFKNKSLGVVSKNVGFYDLGNEEEIELELTSKVPKRFFPLMRDLSNSPEVYFYSVGGRWERIKNANNTISQNLSNPNEKVKLKFDRILNYNPSELW